MFIVWHIVCDSMGSAIVEVEYGAEIYFVCFNIRFSYTQPVVMTGCVFSFIKASP